MRIFTNLLILWLIASKAYAQSAPGHISVSASWDTTIVPNQASFEIYTNCVNKDRLIALDSTLNVINRATSICKRHGVKYADIHTKGVTASVYKQNRTNKYVYAIGQVLTVTVRDTSILDKDIWELSLSEISYRNLEWGNSNTKRYSDVLLQSALREAKRKANLMANEMSLSVGRVINMVDRQFPYGSTSYDMSRANSSAVISVKYKGYSVVNSGINLHPGEIEMSAVVNVTFELK